MAQAKREKAEAAAKGRGEKRAKDFMEKEFGDDSSKKEKDTSASPEVRIPETTYTLGLSVSK